MFSKIALVSLPRQDLLRPPAAIPILAAACEELNTEYEFYDFNLWLANNVDADVWQEIDSNWEKSDSAADKDKEYFKIFLQKLKQYIDIVIAGNIDLVAISVFTDKSAHCAIEFIKELNNRPSRLDFKIIIGGTGIEAKLPTTSNIKLCSYLLNNNLIDYFIYGEGEVLFRKILNHDFIAPGINNFELMQLDNLDDFPYPSYKKINPLAYRYINWPDVMINGSRGCVRKCSYCDVAKYWPKFRYRSGNSLAEELFHTWKTTGVLAFEFSDSLINGNLKEFKIFNRALIKLKTDNPEFDVTYKGQFICRAPGQFAELNYQEMKNAGCSYIYVGVESFSDPVRYSMDKKFDTAALEFHLEMCAKYGISNVFLMIVGYPTETLADHEHNLKALKKYQVYSQAGIIDLITFGSTTSIIEDTPLERMQNVLRIEKEFENFNNVKNWVSASNPTLTLHERVRRWVELVETADNLGYRQTRIDSSVAALTQLLSVAKTKKRIISLTELK
jgi:radical SAM superfamily enzyme YgiQ (UPF0313 family)